MNRTLLSIAVCVALLGCKKKPAPEPVVADAPAPVARDLPPPDVATLQAVARELSIRDPEPKCAEIEAKYAVDPVATFQYVVQTVERPPWTPMRAAGCLIEGHAAELGPTLTGWVRSVETQGLGRLVLARLDELPDPVAESVVKAGLAGPLAEPTADAVQRDGRAVLVELLP